MGNLFSKTRKVAPLSSGQNIQQYSQADNVQTVIWYRKLFCCSGNAVTVLNTSCVSIRDSRDGGDGESSSNSHLARDSMLELQDSENNDEINDSSDALQDCLPLKLELPADRAPLPMIAEDSSCQVIQSGLTVKRNYEGNTRAIAFDVEIMEDEDIPNRPQSSLSMGNATCLPKRLRDRLPALPEISQEIIQRK